MMFYLPWIIVSVLIVALIISLYYNFKFANIIIKMEDEIGDSLDIIDDKYRSISQILEIPLFFDSPQVRKVLDDIRSARNSLLIIANKLASIDQKENIDAENKSTQKKD